MIGAYSDTVYDTLLVVHILCAIVGFGAVTLNGLYARQVQARPGPEGLAIFQANATVSKVGEYFIWAIFPLGLALVAVGNDAWDFGETWIVIAMAVYLVAVSVSSFVLWPRIRRMERLMQEMVASGPPPAGPPPQLALIQKLGAQIGGISGYLHASMVVVIVMMVTKPGS